MMQENNERAEAEPADAVTRGVLRRALGLLVLALLPISIASCGKSGSPAEDNVRQQLVGTWLSEIDYEGAKIRAVTDMTQDGAFRELERAVDSKGMSTEASYGGEWSFDGINFKRKYTSKDGRLLSNSKFEYATYAVRMSKNNEFVGVDNVQQRTVQFARTSAGTRP
ncbi:hypothetical protein C7T35_40260 [Variovorax sp. WS11]|nr:hypothetical protein C7T35_40260 [Variovorax sp. WS11]